VSDQEFLHRFLSLRQRIQQIIHSKTYQVDQQKIVAPSGANKSMQEFYKQWSSSLRPKDLQLRARAKIFTILHKQILDERCFGLNILGENGKLLELRLQEFEEVMDIQYKGRQSYSGLCTIR
jgi:hypothetical protein